jgi:YD repeat-containing protein
MGCTRLHTEDYFLPLRVVRGSRYKKIKVLKLKRGAAAKKENRVKKYHYYDQAGNLVKTLPPAAVTPNFDATYLANVKAARVSGAVVNNPLNNETLATQYRYNTLNQVVAQKTPDAGLSNFYYDRLGRLVVSQNSKQKNQNKYSYTLYDEFGRPKEIGQLAQTTIPTNEITRDPNQLMTWYNNKPADQITRTFFDKSYFDGTSLLCPDILCQRNLRNRVSFTAAYATGTPGNATIGDHTAATFFSYDITGVVDTLLQDYNSGVMKTSGNRFKKLVYNYDLVSGKVNTISYQANQPDAFYHRYFYNAENKLTDVETSNDKIIWERDARYSYYKHGLLARTVLGQNQVQGIDYAYTLQGQLKGINSTSVGDGVFDMGQDGKVGSSNSNIARDVYGISINYFNGDYKPISNAVTPFASIAVGNDLFNGNIKSQVVNIPKLGNPLTYAYKYDQLNRLVAMDAYNGLNNTANTFTPITITDYKERLSYDPNGNIKTYLRNGTGSTISLNNYSYTYTAGTNKLASITNSVNAQTKNYVYDETGNTTNDGMQGMTNAVWNVYGKLQSATNKDGVNITYAYAADGQRISKTVGSVTECYVKDVEGNTMLIYQKDATINAGHLSTKEYYKYGSSLLGIKNRVVDVEVPAATNSTTTFVRGEDNYILADGQGNTKVTIKDTKTQVPDPANPLLVLYYTANINTAIFNSTYGATSKAYGNSPLIAFNGQRKSLEIGIDAQTALHWEYNGDVGKRANVDPKPNVSQSPYFTFGGNPILNSDRLGDTPRVEMNNAFYTLTRGKDNNLKYVGADGSDYTGKLSANATSVMTAFANALKGTGSNVAGSTVQGRANDILNSKFDLFITEDNFALTGRRGEGFDALYAYKMSDGSIKEAKNTEKQPSNSIGAYITLTGFMGSNPVVEAGRNILSDKRTNIIRDLGGPSILTTVHEIFGHGWQAMNHLLSADRILNISGGTVLGAPYKTEADAVTIVNLYALHNNINYVQKYRLEQLEGNTHPTYHKLPWGFLLGTLTSNGFYLPEY